MTEHTASATALIEIDERRPCTRCEGEQRLVASEHQMGKYLCDACELIVGFDLETRPAEFLLSRGQPSRYTKDVFGDRLTSPELRLSDS